MRGATAVDAPEEGGAGLPRARASSDCDVSDVALVDASEAHDALLEQVAQCLAQCPDVQALTPAQLQEVMVRAVRAAQRERRAGGRLTSSAVYAAVRRAIVVAVRAYRWGAVGVGVAQFLGATPTLSMAALTWWTLRSARGRG